MLRSFFNRSHSTTRQLRKIGSRRQFKFRVECLENRRVLAAIMVDTFADVVANDGQTSLREAIDEAAAHPGTDTIKVPSGTYALALGQLTINDSYKVRIESLGGPATIDGLFATRVFEVSAGSEVEMEGLVITQGLALNGAGILNAGELQIEGSTFYFNFAFDLSTFQFSDGSGIYNLGTLDVSGTVFDFNFGVGAIWNNHSLSVEDVTLTNNFGGGIVNTQGSVDVSNSTFNGNTALASGGGGGISSFQGELTVKDSHFNGNTASVGGAGGAIYSSQGPATIETSSFNGNQAGRTGGAIHSDYLLTVRHTSITNNSADIGAQTLQGGGGIYVRGEATITHTDITGNSSFQGNGGGLSVESGAVVLLEDSNVSGNSSIFFSDGGGISVAGTLTVKHCTINDNHSDVGHGAGLFNFGNTTIVDSTISNNSAAFGVGGGIYNIVGELTIERSEVNGNIALSIGGILNSGIATIDRSTINGNQGGGIHNGGTLLLTRSTLSGNSTFFNNPGGGLFNSGTANISDSTFSNNSAGAGGAVANSTIATMTLTNSTFNGNSAGSFGGAIYNASSPGFEGTSFITVVSCTISGNSAGSEGGGIWNSDFDTVTINNTIVAGNTAPVAPDVRGFFTSLGYNLIGIGDGSTGFGATGDIVGTAEDPIDPLLGPLQDNGGPTWTMELLFGSLALDAGDPDLDGTTDQRGVLRPQGAGVDIGAFELED